MEPAFPPCHYVLGLAYEQQGRFPEALAALEKAHAGAPGHPATLGSLGHALEAAGRTSEPEAMLRQLLQLAARTWVPPYYPALVQARLGPAPAALECLEDAYRPRDPYLVWLKTDPRFDILHGDPRFRRLLGGVGIPLP